MPATAAPVAPAAPPVPDEGHLSPAPYPDAPPAVAIRAALWLHRGLQRLADLVVPAHVAVIERSVGVAATQLLGVAARLGIADLLEAGPRTAAELAVATGVDADALHRALRALATAGCFALRPDGRFANTRLSRALRRGTLTRTREWCEYMASGSNVAAWGDFARTVATGGEAFARVHGTSVWAWFDRHPAERETFAQAMMGLTVGDAPVVAALYPFREVRRLCDVGGGRGTLLSELLVRHPHLRGVLCDAPGVVASARALLARRGVADRVECVAGDFFAAVPPGCDAYLLKNVLHDWDDARCRAILRVCRAAMAPGARLVLVEILTERNRTDGFGPLADVQMMTVCGGRERSLADYRALLAATGFRPGRVFPSPTMAVIEGLAGPGAGA